MRRDLPFQGWVAAFPGWSRRVQVDDPGGRISPRHPKFSFSIQFLATVPTFHGHIPALCLRCRTRRS